MSARWRQRSQQKRCWIFVAAVGSIIVSAVKHRCDCTAPCSLHCALAPTSFQQSSGSFAFAGAASSRRICCREFHGVELAQQSRPLPPLLQLPHDVALWRLARPTIAIALLRAAYGVTDSLWVGRLGSTELEAMGASSFAFWTLLLLGEVASMGVHAVVAVREGSGHREGVGEAVVQGLWFSLVCGACALLLLPLIPAYFQLLGLQQGNVVALGSVYLQTLAWGVVPLTASSVLASGFKGIALMRPVFIVNAVCVAANLVLDPLLIWGWCRIPALGIAGAGIATNICTLMATVISFQMLRAEGVPLRLVAPHAKTLALITRIGLPISLGGLLFTGVYVVLGRLLTSLGSANIAALGLGHRIEALAFTICEGFAAATATIVGQWLGAGRAHEARVAAALAATVVVGVMLPLATLFVLVPRPIVRLFTGDPATIAAAASYLRTVGAVFPIMGLEHVMDGALMGAGDTVPSLLLGLVFNVLRIPLGVWLCSIYGVHGVWAAIAISTVAKALLKWYAFRRSRLPLLSEPVGSRTQ